MTAERSNLENAFEATLTTIMGVTDLTAIVDSIGGLTTPCILVIEPDNDAQREFIRFDGTFGASSFVTTAIGNRYLPGSAAGSGLEHPIGSVVASVATAQHFGDVHDRIDVKLDVTGTAADSDKLETHASSYFATDAAVIAAQAAADAAQGDINTHDGSGDTAHADATTSVDGFMTAADKTKLDGIETEAKDDQTVTAGSGLTGGGTGDVTLNHEDTSSAASINNGAAEHVDVLSLDAYGHVTALSKQTMSAADISAVPIAGGTMTGALTAKSPGDASSVGKVRNVYIGTSTPSDAMGVDGDIFIQYST